MPQSQSQSEGESAGTSYRKTLGKIDDDAEFFGYSKLGLLIVFGPALLVWGIVVTTLYGQAYHIGAAVTVVFILLGVAILGATPDHESLLAFTGKYTRYHFRQTPHIHERRRTPYRPPEHERRVETEAEANSNSDDDSDSEDSSW